MRPKVCLSPALHLSKWTSFDRPECHVFSRGIHSNKVSSPLVPELNLMPPSTKAASRIAQAGLSRFLQTPSSSCRTATRIRTSRCWCVRNSMALLCWLSLKECGGQCRGPTNQRSGSRRLGVRVGSRLRDCREIETSGPHLQLSVEILGERTTFFLLDADAGLRYGFLKCKGYGSFQSGLQCWAEASAAKVRLLFAFQHIGQGRL